MSTLVKKQKRTLGSIEKRLNDYYAGRNNYYLHKDLKSVIRKKEKVA